MLTGLGVELVSELNNGKESQVNKLDWKCTLHPECRTLSVGVFLCAFTRCKGTLSNSHVLLPCRGGTKV